MMLSRIFRKSAHVKGAAPSSAPFVLAQGGRQQAGQAPFQGRPTPHRGEWKPNWTDVFPYRRPYAAFFPKASSIPCSNGLLVEELGSIGATRGPFASSFGLHAQCLSFPSALKKRGLHKWFDIYP